VDKEVSEHSSILDQRKLFKQVRLSDVLDQSEEIRENVKDAANQLGSVNALLKQEQKLPVPPIEEVIIQNQEAEQKVVSAAEDLDQVNSELAKVVAKGINIETELIETKNELLEAREDLSKSQAKEKEALELAFHDPLTGLPNRLLFEQNLNHGLRQSKRHGWKLAIMLIDLDKFKSINDSYGHDIGDQVLITVAERLKAFIRGEDIISRWAGDEFVCVLLNINLESDVIRIANKMADLITEDCNLGGISLSVEASIGIAMYPKDGKTADILFKKADRAMYKSKGTDQRVMLFQESN
jgi:diguanylate cyclase